MSLKIYMSTTYDVEWQVKPEKDMKTQLKCQLIPLKRQK